MSKPTITDARAKHLQEYLDEHGITVKNKVHDKPDNFIHAIILWLGALFVANFNVLYATTVGKAIYLQQGKSLDLTDYYTYLMVRHELVHAIDYIRHPVWFPTSYALVLPTLLTMRSFWEERGYTQNILVKNELRAPIHATHEIEAMVSRFTGRDYFWMDYGEARIMDRWAEIIRQIRGGEIMGYFPYDEDYNAHYVTGIQ